MHAKSATAHLQAHQYRGFAPGPRLIVTGAVHGNETCGTRAIERVIDELARGELRIVRGQVTFVPVCNPLAYSKGTRIGDRNLNRRLQPTATPVQYEDHVANVLCPWLAEHDALLDLHSFRSPGQPFVLRGPEDNTGALEPFARAAEESALVAHLGVQRVVEGWMSSYAGGVQRRRERLAAAGRSDAAAIEDPSYGIGTTEYMRSRGGWARCSRSSSPVLTTPTGSRPWTTPRSSGCSPCAHRSTPRPAPCPGRRRWSSRSNCWPARSAPPACPARCACAGSRPPRS